MSNPYLKTVESALNAYSQTAHANEQEDVSELLNIFALHACLECGGSQWTGYHKPNCSSKLAEERRWNPTS